MLVLVLVRVLVVLLVLLLILLLLLSRATATRIPSSARTSSLLLAMVSNTASRIASISSWVASGHAILGTRARVVGFLFANTPSLAMGRAFPSSAF